MASVMTLFKDFLYPEVLKVYLNHDLHVAGLTAKA